MQYLLIIFNAGLVESIYIGQSPLVGNGEEEEIHKRSYISYMIRRKFFMAIWQLMRSSEAKTSSLALLTATSIRLMGTGPLAPFSSQSTVRSAGRCSTEIKLYQFILFPLLMFLGKGMHIRSSYGSHRRPAVIDDISLKVIFLAQRFA